MMQNMTGNSIVFDTFFFWGGGGGGVVGEAVMKIITP